MDYRTDIYSLGLILYEMFTGAPAFRADNAVAVALKQMRESPVPPHEIDPQIPVPIERAILKCLEKEPSKRFQSVAELESALRPQGAAPAATLIGAPPAPVSSTHSTQATPPLPSPPLRLMPPPRKRVSPVVWVLLLVLVALAAVAGERSAQIRQAAATLPPPAPLPAPKPPAFAFDIPPRQAAQPPSALPLPVPKSCHGEA